MAVVEQDGKKKRGKQRWYWQPIYRLSRLPTELEMTLDQMSAGETVIWL
jgi:hypothetical protein